MSRWWKWTVPDRRGPYSGWQWPAPGEWVEVGGPLRISGSGLHVVNDDGLVEGIGPQLWVVEVDGEGVTDDGRKWAFPRARLVESVEAWNERTARLYAADVAEHVLHMFEAERPDDDRPRRAIEVARACAHGEATDSELGTAGAAAGAAARAAAWAAAGDATGDAARVATRVAGWAADEAADERQWQTDRLLEVIGAVVTP